MGLSGMMQTVAATNEPTTPKYSPNTGALRGQPQHYTENKKKTYTTHVYADRNAFFLRLFSSRFSLSLCLAGWAMRIQYIQHTKNTRRRDDAHTRARVEESNTTQNTHTLKNTDAATHATKKNTHTNTSTPAQRRRRSQRQSDTHRHDGRQPPRALHPHANTHTCTRVHHTHARTQTHKARTPQTFLGTLGCG